MSRIRWKSWCDRATLRPGVGPGFISGVSVWLFETVPRRGPGKGDIMNSPLWLLIGFISDSEPSVGFLLIREHMGAAGSGLSVERIDLSGVRRLKSRG